MYSGVPAIRSFVVIMIVGAIAAPSLPAPLARAQPTAD
jgi:hypothetical protein